MCDATETTRTTFEVPECNLATLQERIAKLAKRGRKLGASQPGITVTGQRDEPIKEFDAMTREYKVVGFRRVFTVELTGEAPTIPGWVLIGVIEHGDTELGNVIRVVPGQECPKQFRTVGSWCDHCKTSRRRLETFVLMRSKS